MTRTIVKYEQTDHPMEDVLDIESGTTIVPRVETIPTELVPIEEYDDKDVEVEKQFQEVYDAAMTAFEVTSTTVEQIEPKYRARNEEVAIQYLNTALAAAREKSLMKQHKDKLSVSKGKISGPKTVNQNLFVGNRNELLKELFGKSDPKPE